MENSDKIKRINKTIHQKHIELRELDKTLTDLVDTGEKKQSWSI